MTRNVVRDQAKHGHASAKTFVKKRILRIVPPFLIVALITILISLLLYSPTHLIEVGEQTLRAITFHSNFYFYDQAGYFAPENELRPMLHSWSLSVEEQFYLLFALIIILSKYFRFHSLIFCTLFLSLFLYGLLCLQAASLNFEITHFWPQKAKSEDALFYLTPFRMLQFLAGATLALIHKKSHPSAGFVGGVILIIVGIAILIVIEKLELLIFSNLLATLATILLLQKNKFAAWLGQLNAISFIAKSSYQIYLVHWPLIVFWRYITFDDPAVEEIVVLVALSIGMGWALMKVTHPISNLKGWSVASPLTKFGGVFIGISTLAISGLILHSQGLPSRIPNTRIFVSDAEHREQESSYCKGSHLGEGYEYGQRIDDPLVTCDINSDAEDTIYVFGDSHARHLASGLAKEFPEHRIATLYFSSCPAQSGQKKYIYDYEGRTTLQNACLTRNERAMDLFATAQEATIIIHQYAGYHSDTSPEFYAASQALLLKLESYGHKVLWLGSVIRPNKLLNGCNYLPKTFPLMYIDLRCEGDEEVAQHIISYNAQLENTAPDNYLNMTPFFCTDANAPACKTTLSGKPLFRDKHHLTNFQSRKMIFKLNSQTQSKLRLALLRRFNLTC